MSDPLSSSTSCESVLGRVRARRDRAALLAHFAHWLLILAAIYGAALVARRLLGFGPDLFAPWSPAVVVAGALVLGWITRARTSHVDAARLADRHAQTRDLFLTRVCLDRALGEYRQLVVRDADRRAAELDVSAAVPLGRGLRWRRAAAALALVWIGALALPQLDPFGRESNEAEATARSKTLAQHKKLATKRIAALRKKKVREELSQPIETALRAAQGELRAMKKVDPKQNRARIQREQKALGAQWRTAKERTAGQSPSSRKQSFGGRRSEQSRQWGKDLATGKSDSLKKELEELREIARKLDATDDAQRRELEKRLQKLRDFADRELGSPELRQDLARLMQQLGSMAEDGLGSEALEAFDDTTKLTELEIDALAQSMRDLGALEKALEALQLANMLNELDPLDGEACKECSGMAEYAEFYRQQIGQCLAESGPCQHCKGSGCGQCAGTGAAAGGNLAGTGNGGIGGQGHGMGGVAPVADEPNAQFTPERTRVAMRAGRTLMQWKNTEIADSGRAAQDYSAAVAEVVQGASEAILKENVPLTYHGAIQSYFDQLSSQKKR